MTLDDATDPFDLFPVWFDEARAAEPYNTDAAALATATADGRPSVRFVLVRGIDRQGFVFYTNEESRKGQEVIANPHAALCFYWKSLKRQIRIEGSVAPATEAESDRYYHSRPLGSRIGAWASAQSRPVDSRATIERKVAEYEAKFGDGDIPRPPHWHGFRITPVRFEFWQEQTYRLHDRIQFDLEAGAWVASRLYP
jgi:pyridoxamine 5'-phosphate oxidase